MPGSHFSRHADPRATGAWQSLVAYIGLQTNFKSKFVIYLVDRLVDLHATQNKSQPSYLNLLR